MALRLSKVDAAKGQSEFNAALTADGGVFQEGEGAVIKYPGGNFNSPYTTTITSLHARIMRFLLHCWIFLMPTMMTEHMF